MAPSPGQIRHACEGSFGNRIRMYAIPRKD
jgi:hypothetical protein